MVGAWSSILTFVIGPAVTQAPTLSQTCTEFVEAFGLVVPAGADAVSVTVASVPAGPPQVTLSLRDGKTVEWGSAGNAAQKNRELSVLLPGQARYIDVSAPGTAVTR